MLFEKEYFKQLAAHLVARIVASQQEGSGLNPPLCGVCMDKQMKMNGCSKKAQTQLRGPVL